MATATNVSRKRLLEAARGLLDRSLSESPSKSNFCRPYRYFKLQSHHIQRFPLDSPASFHQALCQRVREARDRVYLASLYIGPAVDSKLYDKEAQFLQALQTIPSNVNVKILLDRNRALRPVPSKKAHPATTITSAQACQAALTKHNQSVYLFSVLPDILQSILPNPYNEIYGVFHLKAYIIDNDLILSGANLSEEYFDNRHDRYLWIKDNEVVDCYADIVETLCQHAQVYGKVQHYDDDSSTILSSKPEVLMESLAKIMTTDHDDDDSWNTLPDDLNDGSTVAYAVPTLQAHFFAQYSASLLPSDVQVMQQLLSTTVSMDSMATARLASAYLNPTLTFQSALSQLAQVHYLTAGRISHGFRPKPKAGNKGKDWIPTVFDTTARSAIHNTQSSSHSLWFYQRDHWTFHAKGLWLSSGGNSSGGREDNGNSNHTRSTLDPSNDSLYCVTHGSGNFGARSEYRDMESNLILVFPPRSPLAVQHVQEWNQMCEYASQNEKTQPLPWTLRLTLPFIRSFF